jgi:hypothetical protein
MSDNKVLRRNYGPKGQKVGGEWRRLLTEELHKFYASPNTIKIMKSNILDGRGM